jgi:ribosome-binding ATPase YchF (GTP1/OBG family)
MKTIGITGASGSGKTTLWRAVTGGEGRGDVGVVDVADRRLDALVRMERSRRRVPVQIEVVDVSAAARTPAAALARLREMDAILVVSPAFGGQDPLPALRGLLEELVLADMAPLEKRLERARKDASARKEVPALEAGLAHLEAGRLLGDRSWEPEELAAFSPLTPLTLKPMVVVWNVDEGASAAPLPEVELSAFPVSAALEAEVAGVDPEEAAVLLSAYGIEERASARVIESVYRLLDLITFFTTGEKESRAWEVRRGASAPEAAGAIHSDLQRGFIRAEVVAFDELERAGSWQAAKSRGLLRLEGKGYVVAEGDVCHFRFAV